MILGNEMLIYIYSEAGKKFHFHSDFSPQRGGGFLPKKNDRFFMYKMVEYLI